MQHYGGTQAGDRSDKQLRPALSAPRSDDLARSAFNVAYRFGVALPGRAAARRPGRPDLAIALLEKGLRAQPDKWEFAQAIGFVHYWWRQDYARRPRGSSAPPTCRARRLVGVAGGRRRWPKAAAATRRVSSGRRSPDRRRRVVSQRSGSGACSSSTRWTRSTSCRRPSTPSSAQSGRPVADWDDLRRAGYLRGTPPDPTGAPYQLESGRVTLIPRRRLYPLPDAAAASTDDAARRPGVRARRPDGRQLSERLHLPAAAARVGRLAGVALHGVQSPARVVREHAGHRLAGAARALPDVRRAHLARSIRSSS